MTVLIQIDIEDTCEVFETLCEIKNRPDCIEKIISQLLPFLEEHE